jgi:hypothetical protein
VKTWGHAVIGQGCQASSCNSTFRTWLNFFCCWATNPHNHRADAQQRLEVVDAIIGIGTIGMDYMGIGKKCRLLHRGCSSGLLPYLLCTIRQAFSLGREKQVNGSSTLLSVRPSIPKQLRRLAQQLELCREEVVQREHDHLWVYLQHKLVLLRPPPKLQPQQLGTVVV